MAQLTDLNKVRARRARQKLVRNFLMLAAFAGIAFGGAYMVRKVGHVDLRSALGDLQAGIQEGTGFPAHIPVGTVEKAFPLNNSLALVTDVNLFTFNDTGRKMVDRQHGLANPTATVAGDRLLLYDQGAMKLSAYTRTAWSWEMTVPFPIYDVDISKNGNFAVATDSDRALAQVSVYNSERANIFNWYSADRPVISVSLADNKDAMTVGCVDVQGGDYHSRISRFQLSVDKEMGSAELPGELLLSVDYTSGNNVYALTDKRAVLLNNDMNEVKDYSFEENRLLRFHYGEDGKLLLLLQKQGGVEGNMIVLLHSNLTVQCSFPVEGQFKGLTMDGKYIYLTDKEKVSIYGENGLLAAVIPINGIQFACPLNNVLYYGVGSQIMAADVRQLVESKNGLSAEKETSSKKDVSSGKDASSETDASTETAASSEKDIGSTSISEEGREDSSSSENEKLVTEGESDKEIKAE